MRLRLRLPYTLVLHLDVCIAALAQVLQEVAPLKVLARVYNGLELGRRHDRFFFGFLDLGLMKMIKHAIGDVS